MISEDTFREEWGAYVKRNGDLFQHADVIKKPLNRVWTIVEAEDDDGKHTHWVALPGFHVVNKLGYCLTQKPWDDDGLQAYWFFDDMPDSDIDDDGLDAFKRG